MENTGQQPPVQLPESLEKTKTTKISYTKPEHWTLPTNTESSNPTRPKIQRTRQTGTPTMTSAEQKLEMQKRLFKNSKKISENDKKWLDKFLDFLDLRRSKSPYTQEKYLRWLRIILENNNFQAHLVNKYHENGELKQINQNLVKDIQNSKYHQKENGEYAKRSKDDQWYTWKRVMEKHEIGTETALNHIPTNTSFSQDNSKCDVQANTSPEDLPTPEDMKKFLQAIPAVSNDKGSLRNICIPLLIYDIGTRVGETLPIQMKQVRINGNRLKIKVNGNKKAEDRTIEVFQGRKTLIDYIEQHPERNDPEAYLFPKTYYNDFHSAISRKQVVKKFRQARNHADLDFKLYGEPFHIFRKAMTTYYVVNDILSWEEVCKRQGKKPDSTMPTYLKMAMQDVDSTAAEGFGLDTETRENDHRMKQPALLPQECRSCGKENRCINETCSSCGTELPENTLPKGENFETSEEDLQVERLKGQLLENLKLAEDLGINTDEL